MRVVGTLAAQFISPSGGTPVRLLNSRDPDPSARGFEWAKALGGGSFQFSGPAPEDQIVAAERELGVMFPRSYRAFLRHYGAGNVDCIEIYGIPRDRLWGDVVMMNQLTSNCFPKHFVKFTGDIGDYSYYLDTSQMDEAGECPVVVFGAEENGRVIAKNFSEFLGEI